MSTTAFTKLPFDEAIDYLKDKVNLPSERWTDLWHGMHSRGFVVSGGMKNDFLVDMHGAVNDAIEKGMAFGEFKKNFRAIVEKHGWAGSAKSPIDTPKRLGWRAATVYNTNLRTAYAQGHYQQMTDPAVLKARPYWRYIGGLSRHPRQLHLEWNGTILSPSDKWWDTHYPPNGWGCKCKVVSASGAEMTRDGLQVTPAPDDGNYKWDNPNTGETVEVPNGIDPGWAYNPGQAAWGKTLSDDAMAEWDAQKGDAWKPLTPGNWETEGLPEKVVFDEPQAKRDYSIPGTAEGMTEFLKKELGGDERIFSFEGKNGFRYDVLVNAESLGRHLKPDRAPFLPFLAETMNDPGEVWMSFEQHEGTGQVVLRQRIIKGIDLGGDKGLLVAVNANKGMMESWTFFPTSGQNYINKQRGGKLIWRRE